MMNLPPTYGHDYGYEPPRPAPVYDIPQIVERRPAFDRLRSALLLLRRRPFAIPTPTVRSGVGQPTAACPRARTSPR